MVILDVAIVNVALPSIKSDLGFSATGLQWVITAYAIIFGGTLLLGGRLADLLGRRRMFIAGLALFSASSLLCGFAWSSGSLVAFRALQGLGGALLAPAALSLLMTTFAEGRERNLALGIYGAASGSGAAAGVLLGGVLTSYFGWSWIFFINVPVGVAAIALTPFLLRDSRAELAHRHFDLAGAATVTGGLMLLVYATHPRDDRRLGLPVTLGLLGGAAALIAAFIAIEPRSHAPLLPLRIFRLAHSRPRTRRWRCRRGDVLGVLRAHAVRAGSPPLFGCAERRRLCRLRAVGRRHLEPRAGRGRALRCQDDADDWAHARDDLTRPVDPGAGGRALLRRPLPGLRARRCGLGFSFVPVTIASLAGVERADAGVASGLVNTSRQIGGAVGLATISTIAASARPATRTPTASR